MKAGYINVPLHASRRRYVVGILQKAIPVGVSGGRPTQGLPQTRPHVGTCAVGGPVPSPGPGRRGGTSPTRVGEFFARSRCLPGVYIFAPAFRVGGRSAFRGRQDRQTLVFLVRVRNMCVFLICDPRHIDVPFVSGIHFQGDENQKVGFSSDGLSPRPARVTYATRPVHKSPGGCRDEDRQLFLQEVQDREEPEVRHLVHLVQLIGTRSRIG